LKDGLKAMLDAMTVGFDGVDVELVDVIFNFIDDIIDGNSGRSRDVVSAEEARGKAYE
jgi:hypothetical protein